MPPLEAPEIGSKKKSSTSPKKSNATLSVEKSIPLDDTENWTEAAEDAWGTSQLMEVKEMKVTEGE